MVNGDSQLTSIQSQLNKHQLLPQMTIFTYSVCESTILYSLYSNYVSDYVMGFENYFQVVCPNQKMVVVKTMLLFTTEENVTRILIHLKDTNGYFMEIFSVRVLLIKPPFLTDNSTILPDMPKVISIEFHFFELTK